MIKKVGGKMRHGGTYNIQEKDWEVKREETYYGKEGMDVGVTASGVEGQVDKGSVR